MNADPPIARYVPHSPDSIVPMNMCGTSYERLLVAPFHDGNPGISLKALSAVPTQHYGCGDIGVGACPVPLSIRAIDQSELFPNHVKSLILKKRWVETFPGSTCSGR